MQGFRYLDEQVTLEFDESACTGCGVCVQVCPHGVFEIAEGRARIVDLGACMECGACKRNCAFGAIEVRPGVGCASAIIASWFRRDAEPTCGPKDSGGSGGCC